MTWIPITERLPESSWKGGIAGELVTDYVLIWCTDGFGKWHVEMAYYSLDRYFVGMGEMPIGYDVTHWMPLPEGPSL